MDIAVEDGTITDTVFKITARFRYADRVGPVADQAAGVDASDARGL
jgi:hypothetical protein